MWCREPITRLLGMSPRIDDRVHGDVLAPLDQRRPPAGTALLGQQVSPPVPQHPLGIVEFDQRVGDVVVHGACAGVVHDREGKRAVTIGQRWRRRLHVMGDHRRRRRTSRRWPHGRCDQGTAGGCVEQPDMMTPTERSGGVGELIAP